MHLATKQKIKFIDLFAGLGGFHQGLKKIEGTVCVFASELDLQLRALYEKNHGITAHGDITKICEKDIPHHDLICAGFPCQPFSLAGKKNASQCPKSGKLINDILRIISYHKPKFLLLENVPNLLKVEDGKFWNYIINSLKNLGYDIKHKILSPHDYGIPHRRERLFIVGSLNGLNGFTWPSPLQKKPASLEDIFTEIGDFKEIEEKKIHVLEKWQQLVKHIAPQELRCTSIIAPEFGANYPYDFRSLTLEEIKKYRGAFGKNLEDCKNWNQALEYLPHYARSSRVVPNWLTSSCVFTRKLYNFSPKWFDNWKATMKGTHNSWQKLEWRGYKDEHDIWEHIIQFRASGIRVIKKKYAPSLISMTPTQIPIIGNRKRYMSVQEAAKLQSLEGLQLFPRKLSVSFRALGNAVNSYLVELVSKQLIIQSKNHV